MPTDFTQFRVVECFRAVKFAKSIQDSIDVNSLDGFLHLVTNARDLHALCCRDVAHLTQLKLRDFGHPAATDVNWCCRCLSRFQTMEEAGLRAGQVRRWNRVPDDVANELRRLIEVEGFSQSLACLRLGIPQATASKVMERLKRVG
jgi:hypothetical protein